MTNVWDILGHLGHFVALVALTSFFAATYGLAGVDLPERPINERGKELLSGGT
jgi:hypothetical protein